MTDQLRQTAQQALEALEWISALQTGGMIQVRATEPQAGLRMALEQQAEPVYRKGCAECGKAKQVQEDDDEWKADLAKGRKILARHSAEQQQAEPVCWCRKCNENRLVNNIPFSMTRMILCPTCGNKRCPKASDHRLDCTGSNETGQPGSVYPALPQQQAEPVFDCPQKTPLTHEQRLDVLTAFEKHKAAWNAPSILIDLMEAAHNIK